MLLASTVRSFVATKKSSSRSAWFSWHMFSMSQNYSFVGLLILQVRNELRCCYVIILKIIVLISQKVLDLAQEAELSCRVHDILEPKKPHIRCRKIYIIPKNHLTIKVVIPRRTDCSRNVKRQHRHRHRINVREILNFLVASDTVIFIVSY